MSLDTAKQVAELLLVENNCSNLILKFSLFHCYHIVLGMSYSQGQVSSCLALLLAHPARKKDLGFSSGESLSLWIHARDTKNTRVPSLLLLMEAR